MKNAQIKKMIDQLIEALEPYQNRLDELANSSMKDRVVMQKRFKDPMMYDGKPQTFIVLSETEAQHIENIHFSKLESKSPFSLQRAKRRFENKDYGDFTVRYGDVYIMKGSEIKEQIETYLKRQITFVSGNIEKLKELVD